MDITAMLYGYNSYCFGRSRAERAAGCGREPVQGGAGRGPGRARNVPVSGSAWTVGELRCSQLMDITARFMDITAGLWI